ncbi:MAG TPA: phosphoribosylanthranilate isomerase [Thermoanaerobaculia bacterium]|nr:phosphoribosylanthranilate isomerase [Thermoanaerobaculia bacterium]
MTEVKVCGLTRPEDVALACALGARYVGFNFAAVSPRRISIEQARELAEAVAPGVARVGVFVGESRGEILRAVEAASLDFIQLHRPFAARDLDAAPRPVLAVSHVGTRVSAAPDSLLARCHAVLFDTATPERAGGSGRSFDWGLVAERTWPVPVFLAGGLVPENVGEAIARGRPAAVDVASGAESSPGIKDPSRLRKFFRAVKEADAVRA